MLRTTLILFKKRSSEAPRRTFVLTLAIGLQAIGETAQAHEEAARARALGYTVPPDFAKAMYREQKGKVAFVEFGPDHENNSSKQ